MRKSETFWIIITDKGHACQWTISYVRKDAIYKFENKTGVIPLDWKEYRIKKGYRCSKVHLVEEK